MNIKEDRHSLLIKQLSDALKSENADVRQYSVDKLVRIGWKPSTLTEQITYFIASNKWHELLKMGDAAVNPIIKCLTDNDYYVQKLAIDTLGDIGNKNAIKPLVAILRGNDTFTKKRPGKIKGLLSNLIAGSKTDPPENSKIAFSARDTAKKPADAVYGNESLRTAAAKALGKIGDVSTVKHLVGALKDSNPEIRACAFKAICTMKAKAVYPLISALHSPDRHVRGYAAKALGMIGEVSAVLPLISSLSDEEPSIRETASESLGIIGDLRAVNALKESLKDDEPFVRESATLALGRIGSDKAVPCLIDALNDDDSFVRRSAVKSLGMTGDERAIVPLLAMLKDEDKWVRRAVAQELRNINSGCELEPLITALSHGSIADKEEAVDALKKLNDFDTLKPLIELLKKGMAEDFGKAAAKILSEIPKPLFHIPTGKHEDAKSEQETPKGEDRWAGLRGDFNSATT